MAEPSPTSPPAAVSERDLLLTTKLHVPRPGAGCVPRARLLERLDAGTERELVLVCTPAGFGKTTLLADWVRDGRRPVAWLSLDDGDNDPVRFWRHVAAALERVHPGVARRVAPLLCPPAPASFEGLVTDLVNELAAGSEVVVLVLDDYHLIRAPEVHASVEFLLAHLPGSLRLVLASRTDPPLPLPRLRARGQLTEIREADLRFTPDEAAHLLRAGLGPELPDAVITALEHRTEGWVVGLQLAALSLHDHPDVAAFVAGFSGSHRYVLDYLTEEVLDRQPEDLRAFLLETSLLDRLSGPLCDAVTGCTHSQDYLAAIERANLFLLPLDEVRGWWRYHHLFADLLRARLHQERPGRVAEIHRAAAAWTEQHGLVDDAVRHYLAAGETALAARLIEENFEALGAGSEDATVRRWLEALPAGAVRSRPRLCLAQAFWAVIGGRLEAVEPLLLDAERGIERTADEAFEPSVGRAASLVANVPAAIARLRAAVAHLRGDAEQTVTYARQALAELDDGEWMLASVSRWYLATADWTRGRPAEAELGFTSGISSIAGWRSGGQLTLAAWGYHYLAQVQRAQGRLGAALETYRQALLAVAEPGQPAPPAAGIAYVGMAEVHYDRVEMDAALDHATRGAALSGQLGWTLPHATGLAVLARIRQAQGDHAGALAAARGAELIELSPSIVGLMNPVPALRARLALAGGDVAGAARWVEARGLAVEDEPSYPAESDHLVLARVLLAEQAPERALDLLERWHAPAMSQGRTGSVIELRALQALALAAYGDEPAALTTLAGALALAAPERHLQVFVQEGPPMAALVRKLLARRRREQAPAADGVPLDYLARLATAFDQVGTSVVPPPRRGAVVVPGLPEALTPREAEVLALLATGQPNRGIADELVLTLDTVKRHVSHLLDKLQVANRTEAVARARELGLLP